MPLREPTSEPSWQPRFEVATAYALTPTPEYGLALAECYHALDKLNEAREAALAVAELPRGDASPNAAKAREAAATLAASLEPRIPSLQVKLAGDPDGATLTVNDKPMSVDALAAPLRLNPGDYTFVLKYADGSVARRTVSLREGESRKLRLDPHAAEQPANGVTPQQTSTSAEGAATQAKEPPRPPQNAITTALLAPILSGEVNIEYERAIVPALSFYAGPSVVLWNGALNANNSAGYAISGWGFDAGLRAFPLAGSPGGGATRGLWIAADARYVTLSLTAKNDATVSATGSDVRVGALVGFSLGPEPLVFSVGVGGGWDVSQATAVNSATGSSVTLSTSGPTLMFRMAIGFSF